MADLGGRPGRKRSNDAREAIIQAALSTLREVGFHQLTMEGVAARAGVAKATVYRWWPTKASLCIEALRDQLGEPLQPTGDTRQDVRAMVRRIMVMVNGLVGQIMVFDVVRDPHAGAQLEEMLGPYRAAHKAILLAAAGRGDLPYDIDAGKTLDLVSGIALVRMLMQRSIDDELVDQITTLVLTGELPRVRAPSRGSPSASVGS